MEMGKRKRDFTLFTSCYIDVFPWLKHWLSDYMRQDMDFGKLYSF